MLEYQVQSMGTRLRFAKQPLEKAYHRVRHKPSDENMSIQLQR